MKHTLQDLKDKWKMILEITTTYGRYIKISLKKSYENVYKKEHIIERKDNKYSYISNMKRIIYLHMWRWLMFSHILPLHFWKLERVLRVLTYWLYEYTNANQILAQTHINYSCYSHPGCVYERKGFWGAAASDSDRVGLSANTMTCLTQLIKSMQKSSGFFHSTGKR